MWDPGAAMWMGRDLMAIPIRSIKPTKTLPCWPEKLHQRKKLLNITTIILKIYIYIYNPVDICTLENVLLVLVSFNF